MIDRPTVTVAVEGPSDEAVLRRVLAFAGLDVDVVHGQQGKAYLDKQLRGFNNAARFHPWVVLRDLDRDADCAPELLPTLLPKPASWMRLRLAVRAVEAWLLADRDRVTEFFSVPMTAVPTSPDDLDDPKRALVALARRSTSRAVRNDMLPENTTSAIGPGYTARLIEFAMSAWRPTEARRHSPSLERAVGRLRRLAKELKNTGGVVPPTQ